MATPSCSSHDICWLVLQMIFPHMIFEIGLYCIICVRWSFFGALRSQCRHYRLQTVWFSSRFLTEFSYSGRWSAKMLPFSQNHACERVRSVLYLANWTIIKYPWQLRSSTLWKRFFQIFNAISTKLIVVLCAIFLGFFMLHYSCCIMATETFVTSAFTKIVIHDLHRQIPFNIIWNEQV